MVAADVTQAPATEREPTSDQIGAAIMAYDEALPVDARRPPLSEHLVALTAAITAALRKG